VARLDDLRGVQAEIFPVARADDLHAERQAAGDAGRRARGPCTDMSWMPMDRSSTVVPLQAGTRPSVGRMPATPQQQAG
jgi:hypothetical protein